MTTISIPLNFKMVKVAQVNTLGQTKYVFDAHSSKRLSD